LSCFPDLSKYFARNIKLLAEFDHYQKHFMLDYGHGSLYAKRLLIGSQRAEELEEAIRSIKK
jgi:hypothetical protein